MLREKIYCDRKEIDDFLLLSPAAALNQSIYDALLPLREPDPNNNRLHRLQVPALQIFNEAYYQCTKLHSDKHPEEDIYTNYYVDARQNLGSSDAAEVVFSIVFVLLSCMAIRTVKTGYFAQLISERLSNTSPYFGLFTPIVEQYQSKGHSFPLSFSPMPLDVRFPDRIDWASITQDFNPNLIAEAVLLSDKEDGQHAILDAIESQLRQSHPFDSDSPLDAAFASLRAAIIARFPKGSRGLKKEECLAINSSLISQKKEVEQAFADLTIKYHDLATENQQLRQNQFTVTALLQIARDKGISDLYQVLTVFASGIADLPARIKAEQEIAAIPKAPEPFASEIYLNPAKGTKLNIERIIDCTWALGFYKDARGEPATQKKVFEAFSRLLNSDLSNFAGALSEGRSRANNDCSNELAIFEAMLNRQKKINGLPI